MKNKGFTLVEIMAVLVIMGVLLLVTVPSVFNSLDKKKNREHEQIIEEIKSAAELYVTQNEDVQTFLNSAGSINISYATLVAEGLINGNEIDPLTSEPWNTNSYVFITKEDKKMLSEYKEGNITPSIKLQAVDIELSTTESYFVDKLIENVTATDENGIDYKSAVTYTCKINKTGNSTKDNCKSIKNTPGTHEITYTLIINNTNSSKTVNITTN